MIGIGKTGFLKAGVAAVALALAASAAISQGSAAERPTEWLSYGVGGGTNFSPLKQITPENVAKLQRVWTWRYGAGTSENGDQGLDHRWEVQPLLIDGVLYVSTPTFPTNPDMKASVTALVPETGAVLWRYESPRNIHGRGLAYWPGDGKTGPRFFYGTDKGYLAALDIKSHQLAQDFGDKGEVDAYAGVVSEKVGESKRNTWTIPNPVAIYQNLVITSARPGESRTPGPRSDLRAWDARTGKLVWSFHTIPLPGDPYHDTWPDDEWKDRSGANVWSTMVVDQKNGIVFAPLGDANFVASSGPELFSNTLVALEARTGKMLWHYQLVHKDIWDMDLPTPPVLVDFHRDGKSIPAVAITGKTGLFFVFDRFTGKPLIDIEERPTPRPADDDVPWPTQPFPVRPASIVPTGMTRDQIANVTPEQHAYCTKFWDDNNMMSMGVFSRPPKDRTAIVFPTSVGGPNWGPPSYDPDTGTFIVNSQNIGILRRAQSPAPAAQPAPPAPGGPGAAGPGGVRTGVRPIGFAYEMEDGTQLPCTPTPWGSLVAISVDRGEILWRVPLGDTPSLGEKGIGTGARNIGGNIQTASGLVFVGASNDARFRAFDTKTGKLLWMTELDASAHSTPITYIGRDGRQYVLVVGAGGTAIGSKRMSDTLNAFALP